MSLKQTAKQTSPRTKRNLKNDYAAPALDKGLDVIELLAHQTVGLSMSQIARELNRSVSEIFRMLLCLEHRGYIAQAGAEKYSLTLKLFKLVQEHPPTERLISEALPVMHRLASQTMQSCHLGVVESGRVVILAQVNAPTSVGFYVKLGSTVDIMEASSGYVILAHQNKAALLYTYRENALIAFDVRLSAAHVLVHDEEGSQAMEVVRTARAVVVVREVAYIGAFADIGDMAKSVIVL
ncbi:IclR family transcriptional regulator [Terriglobus sp. YAF25]|uniref:IclR family transcriptional regulator n=1 Tax=Terriglobus sp. YAF25 TaxID=3233080 RepID=UPI003F97045C